VGHARREGVPAKFKIAVQFLIETKNDIVEAARHANMPAVELRRAMGQPQCLRYAREQKKLALEALCLASPANLREVLRGSNEMAKVRAVQVAEALAQDAVELEQRAVQRAPGLQIVIIERDGAQRVAYQPPEPAVPMLDVAPEPEVVPVSPDAEA
jgi:hypothetical protein